MTTLLIGTKLLFLLYLLHPARATHKRHHYHSRKDAESSATKRQYLNQPYNRLQNPYRQIYNPFFYKKQTLPYYIKNLLRNQPSIEPDSHASMTLKAPTTPSFAKSIVGKGNPLLLQHSPSSKLCDDTSDDRKGSFKIDDGTVQGFGTYEIIEGEVIIDLTIKISYQECGKPNAKPPTTGAEGGGEKPAPAPGGGGNETTPSPGGAEEEDVAAFEQEALKAHNDYRTRHDAPPMTLNKELSASAAEWAKELASNDKFEHSASDKRENQGENIASLCAAKGETATDVTKRWYDEVCDPGYDFSRNNMDWGAGHFSQIVWNKSNEFGIGYYDKKRDDGQVCRTVVARYKEPGNGGGAFLDSVKIGFFDKDKDCPKNSRKRASL